MRSLLFAVLMFPCGLLAADDRPGSAKSAGVSDAGVADLKVKISKLTFPVPDFTLERMLPVYVEERAFAFADAFGEERDDDPFWIGGKISDFTLNDDYVLRVTYAYYAKSEDEHWTLQERAVVLRRDQLDGDRPDFRPLKKKPIKAVDPTPGSAPRNSGGSSEG